MEDKIKREHPVNAIECPKCGKQMRLRHVDDTTSVMGFDKDISFYEYFCVDCNLHIGTIEQTAAVQAAIANNYLEEILKKGGRIVWQENSWNLFDFDGEGLALGDTIQDMLVGLCDSAGLK